MNKKNYETDDKYLLEILEDEEERLLGKLTNILSNETKYLFYKYVSVRDLMEDIKYKIV